LTIETWVFFPSTCELIVLCLRTKFLFHCLSLRLRYVNWYQSLDYLGLMTRNGNAGNHSDDEEWGVQALWAAYDAQGQRLCNINRMMREIEQTIAGLGLNGKRYHYHNQNCVDEMTRGRQFVDRVPTPQAVTFTMKEWRAAQQFTPSQTSSSAQRPVVAH